LVQRIIRAYDEHKTKLEEQQQLELLDAKAAGNGNPVKTVSTPDERISTETAQ
jgi:hypothetical protein